jgi:hypothetical protein
LGPDRLLTDEDPFLTVGGVQATTEQEGSSCRILTRA